eukprot:PhM_4_TR11295/c0_g1_i1/m.93343/K10866/RAD50; DNA repair protein RAD50
MSSIHKLQICGVRSFNPSHESTQAIEFHRPLTIILGRNGAGKTTIIEACLNACTGQLPSGEKCSFIHDPRVAGEADVRAQVRFTFRAKSGKDMQVTRTYQAVQSRTKTTFSTMDASLAYRDPETNKITSGTFRCAEIDKMLPELLGVSAAVLESVVFCHQEESTWPLGAPSDVKKRLDDIFASTKYVSALDKFREAAKSYRAQVKQHEGTILVLHEHCDQAQAIRKELADKESQATLRTQRAGEIDMRKSKLEKVLSALDAVSHKAEGLQQQRDRLRGALEEKQNIAKDLRSRRRSNQPLPPHLEVRRLLTNHDEEVRKAEKERKQNQTTLDRLEADKSSTTADLHSSENQLVNLKDKDVAHQRRVNELQALVSRTAKKFNIELTALVGSATLDVQGMMRFSEIFDEKVTALSKERDVLRTQADHAVSALDKQREAITQRQSVLTHERQQRGQRINEIQTELTRMKSVFDSDRSFSLVSPTAYEALRRSFDETKRALEERKNHLDRSKARLELQQTLSHIDAANKAAQVLRAELDERKAERDVTSQLGLLRQTHKAKAAAQEQILKERIYPQFKQMFGQTITTSAHLREDIVKGRNTVEETMKKHQNMVFELEKSAAVLRRAIEDKSGELSKKRQFIESKSDALNAFGDVDSETDIDRLRTDAEDECSKSVQDMALLQTELTLTENLIASSREHGSCESCDRPLSKTEQAEFIKRQKDKQTALKKRVKDANIRHQNCLERLNILRENGTTIQEVMRVQAEVAVLQAAVKDAEKELKTVNADLHTAKDALKVATDDAHQVNELANDVETVLGLVSELERLTAEITKLEKSTGVSSTKRALDIVAAEYDTTQRQLQELNQRLVRVQGEAEAEAKEVQGLEKQLHAKELELSNADAARQRCNDMTLRYESLKAEVAQCEVAIRSIDEKLGNVATEVTAAAKAVEKQRAAYRQKEQELQQQLDTHTREQQLLVASVSEVRSHLELNISDKMSALSKRVAECRARLTKIAETETAVRAQFHQSSRYVDEQATVRRELEDAMRIYEAEEEVTTLHHKLQKIDTELQAVQQQQLSGLLEGVHQCAPSDTVWSLRDKIKSQIGDLQQEAARHRGAIDHLNADINDKKDRLQKEKFVDIERRLASTQIKLRTAELATADIDKYYKALDRAVTQYHSDKMKELNAIIAHLWRTTYAGSDIDSIEIKFDEEGATAGTSGRRNYKYRVVMRKGDAELDMRGRCSAGQKVLASVVIRLALSEAFCCDCGILVLDEPTTNLDEDNVISLARALRSIIEARRGLRHFQLVVITHDEAFVKELGARTCETYYYVHKTMDGRYSLIDKVPISRLFE